MMDTSWSVIFDDAPMGVLLTEGTRHIVRYANPAFCRFVAMIPEQLIGQGIAEMGLDSVSRVLTLLIDKTNQGQAPRAQTWNKGTAEHPLLWTAAAWRVKDGESGEPRTIVAVAPAPLDAVPQTQYKAVLEEMRAVNSQLVVSNLRTQELLDEADHANRAKDDFLAMLGHELRNPLAPIRNSVEILRCAELSDPKTVAAREMIARQTMHMARLVDDLLDVARLAHGKISLQKERLDVVEVVRTILTDFRTNFESANLSVHPTLPADPLWIVGDRTRVAQIVGNIIHNAIKFTEPGGQVWVQITAREGAATITVRDSGVGMEPQMVRDAFDPFRQADNTLSRSRGGLGVGLSLAKALVELHQGTICAASVGLGKGSEFVVSLPLTHVPDATTAGATGDRPIAHSRVLVVEDNVDAAESLRVLLELHGHTVSVVHNGREAWSTACAFQPDVVLCDIGLPGDMDGYAVARAIHDDPRVPTPRMIAISGYGRDSDVGLARAAGFDHHLTKPVDPQRLFELLTIS